MKLELKHIMRYPIVLIETKRFRIVYSPYEKINENPIDHDTYVEIGVFGLEKREIDCMKNTIWIYVENTKIKFQVYSNVLYYDSKNLNSDLVGEIGINLLMNEIKKVWPEMEG